FNFLEFRSLWDRLVEAVGDGGGGLASAGPAAEAGPPLEAAVHRVHTVEEAVKAISALPSSIAVDTAWEGQPGRSELLGLAVTMLSPDDEPADGEAEDVLCSMAACSCIRRSP